MTGTPEKQSTAFYIRVPQATERCVLRIFSIFVANSRVYYREREFDLKNFRPPIERILPLLKRSPFGTTFDVSEPNEVACKPLSQALYVVNAIWMDTGCTD